ncbi:1061_t:CDS:2 [Dentiscutata heterogama]|uniref:1061_t:CDS:1 n=1 Tax=Dentiscutata heterogama TaxID=1316150 RepID=A0ACA9LVI4_9GLOM|nr:1061_t:CDS:2 [Dentiscutata heterogama]
MSYLIFAFKTNDLEEVNIKRVLKGSGTGKITKILNNDNLLICKSDGKECLIDECYIVQVLSS